ncbi:MAG: I78 family peptidase inhibitor [Luteimonas sp.]
MPRLIIPLLLSLSLAACAPGNDKTVSEGAISKGVPSELYPVDPAQQPPAESAVASSPPMMEENMDRSCNADAARGMIGKTATADVVEQARIAAEAQIARTLKPGQMVTMEYHPSRLNIDVDDANRITNVRCG